MSKYVVNSWITLAYDDEHLTHYLNGEIYYRDVQSFIKLLHGYRPKLFHYLCSSEYGSGARRPHGSVCDAEILTKSNEVGRYVASYTTKKIIADEFLHRVPEKLTCSKAIGSK